METQKTKMKNKYIEPKNKLTAIKNIINVVRHKKLKPLSMADLNYVIGWANLEQYCISYDIDKSIFEECFKSKDKTLIILKLRQKMREQENLDKIRSKGK